MPTATVSEVLLGSSSQIPPGEGRVFSVAGTEIAVFHTRAGQVYAVQAECPAPAGAIGGRPRRRHDGDVPSPRAQVQFGDRGGTHG